MNPPSMTSPSRNPVSNDRRPQRSDESKITGFRFTKFLIETGAISLQQPKLTRTKFFEHFGAFQARFPNYIQAVAIVGILNKSNLLVRKSRTADVSPDEIEFKKLVFHQTIKLSGTKSDIETRQGPRKLIFVNESQVFQKTATKTAAISGRKCLICVKTFRNDDEVAEHINSELHKLRELYRTEKRKLNVEIPGLKVETMTTHILETDDIDESTVRISNTSKNSFEIVEVHPLVVLEEVHVVLPAKRIIKSGEVLELKMIASFPQYCTYEYPVVLIIRDTSDDASRHQLLIVVTYKVLKQELHDLYSDSTYKSNANKKWVVFEDAPVISGMPVLSSTKIRYKVNLSQYPIPGVLIKFLKKGFKLNETSSKEEELRLRKIKETLSLGNAKDSTILGKDQWTKANYAERFKLLLHLEEYQQSFSMITYNRQDVQLIKGESGRWELEVPGLSEGRPSILKGDSLFVRRTHKHNKYEGIVHDVRENTASLAFNSAFNYVPNEKVGIEFQLNRMSFRIIHRAVELISKENLVSFAFPALLNNDTVCTYVVKQCFNKQIEDNTSQKLAVNNIVRNTAYPAPYIVYGPPGTGKTSTVVEAIAQLARKEGNTYKICACAPSNAAANLIASKLVKYVPESQILRLFGLSYPAREVPEELRKCSNFTGVRNDLLYPSCEVIKSKKIVIVTPITAGRLYGFLGEAHFDYLFFDEAGQADEPLALVPITGLLKRAHGKFSGNLILAGDPKQLGPIIHSRMADELGLGVSLIERLMDTTEPYMKRDGLYNANYVTKLTYNYRSHPRLLDVPNELFYDNELQSHADKGITQWLCSWDRLPAKNIPLIFHGVKGKDDRESNSPSYYNLDEINQVGSYLADLLGVKIQGREVKQQDVVVLTPYRKQVQKFRQYFKKKRWDNVRVSSIEQFQGQESSVVILSCVRSRIEFLSSDYQFGLGFLRNPKRFNVAITRAKSLLIVVGNPNILQCDTKWRVFLKYCKANGCYKGAQPDGEVPDTDPNRDLALDLSALAINEVPDEEKPSLLKDE